MSPYHSRLSTQFPAAARGLLIAEKKEILPLFLFALVWNLIVGFAVYQTWGRNDTSFGHYFILLFPLIGMLLIGALIYMAFVRLRAGAIYLHFEQAPMLGAHALPTKLYFLTPLGKRKFNSETHYPLNLELRCEHVDSREEDTRTRILLQKVVAQTTVLHGVQEFSFTLNVPASFPASAKNGEQEYVWSLILHLFGSSSRFVVPILDNPTIPCYTQANDAGNIPDDALIPNRPKPWPQRILIAVMSLLFLGFFFWDIVQTFIHPWFETATETRTPSLAKKPPSQTTIRIDSLSQLRQHIEHGSDINQRDSAGRSLLMLAIEQGQHEAVDLLLNRGADVNLATPVDTHGEGGRTALYFAIEADATAIVARLLQAHANPTARSNQVWTPLHYAAYRGAIGSLHALLQHSVDVNARFDGARGSTALMIAAQYQQLDAIRVLLQAGADPGLQDRFGENACGYARYFQKEEAARVLSCK